MIRRPPRSTPLYSSAASDVYKRQSSSSSSRSSSSSSSSMHSIRNSSSNSDNSDNSNGSSNSISGVATMFVEVQHPRRTTADQLPRNRTRPGRDCIEVRTAAIKRPPKRRPISKMGRRERAYGRACTPPRRVDSTRGGRSKRRQRGAAHEHARALNRAAREDPARQSKNCAANFRLGATRFSIDREQFLSLIHI